MIKTIVNISKSPLYLAIILPTLLLGACSTNPVTGEKELAFVGEQQEQEIGRKHYQPSRQAQGGDYVVDKKLLHYVQSVGQRLAKVSDRKLDYEFQIVNDGTPNAWALPGGKIAVHRGLLLELKSEAELAAVLAHEVVHAAARHTAKNMERGMIAQGVVLAGSVTLAGSRYRQVGMLGVTLGASLTNMHFGRDAERESDYHGIRYMVRAGYDPRAAVDLQKTFVRLHDGKEPNWLAGLFASHPPSPERVQNNKKQLAQLGNPGGELGIAAYQQATAHLRRTKVAYEHYEQAIKALENKQNKQALSLVQKAIRIEPKEALFHALQGDILQQQKRYQGALKNYNKALQYNPDYFRFYLSRGLLQQRLQKPMAAQQDLQKSIKLLPTAEASYGLGSIAKRRGRITEARHYFSQAAQSNSLAGKRAQQELARMGK